MLRYPILTYHQVQPLPEKADVLRNLSIDPGGFRRQMMWLSRMGYAGVSVRELMCYLRGEKCGKVIGLTFDDGFRNVLKNAMPILDEFGFTATCYIVSGKIGGLNDWDLSLNTNLSQLMSEPEMRLWSDRGHEIGAHTVNHTALSKLTPDLAWQEISDSKRQLEKIIDKEVESFCYPYGDFNKNIVELVSRSGFSNAATTMRRVARPCDASLLLPRISVSGDYGIVRFLFRSFR
ncbi:polysaccharide deacetylase family protein (plasmid) [Burkholderia ambifaria]